MRVGILSFAHVHADAYASLLPAFEDVEVIGFSDTDPIRGRQATDAYGLRWFERHEDLVAAGPDALVICSENANHRDHVELAAAAGCHVLCEKPIASTLADAEAMKRAVDRAGVTFMTAFPMRFELSTIALKAMIDRGDLGRVRAINGINHAEIPRRHRAWFADPELAGGGAVMDHTVHLLDLYRWLLGGEARTVYAEVGNPFHPDVEVDTAGLITVGFEDGVFATIDCSWSRPEAVYPSWGHVKMELFGERGATEVDVFAQHLDLYSASESPQASWLGWGANSDLAMIEAFLACVRDGGEPPVTWNDGYQALRVALAAYESAERSAPVVLEHGAEIKG